MFEELIEGNCRECERKFKLLSFKMMPTLNFIAIGNYDFLKLNN